MFFNLCLQDYRDIHLLRETRTKASIPVCHRPFLFRYARSTGSKQTLNGLFLCDLYVPKGNKEFI